MERLGSPKKGCFLLCRDITKNRNGPFRKNKIVVVLGAESDAGGMDGCINPGLQEIAKLRCAVDGCRALKSRNLFFLAKNFQGQGCSKQG